MTGTSLPPTPAPARDAGGVASAWLVFLVAALVLGLYGHEGKLFHDDAIYFYGGQEVLRGVPPYVGIFEHKAPLGQLSCAVGCGIARLLGSDDLVTARWTFLFAGAAAVALLYRLVVQLFGSRTQGWLTAAVLLSCWGFGSYAFSGTRPKLLMVTFQVAALVYTARRAWFRAGLFGALAAWTWQPTAIYAFAAVLLAGVQPPPGERRRALLRAGLGMVLPAVAIVAYYAAEGALSALWDGAVLFNLKWLQVPTTPRDHLAAMVRSVLFTKMGIPVALGLVSMGGLLAWRVRVASWRGLARDPFAVLLLTFPFPVVWSLIDFQGYPDFWIFLPYATLGFAWLLHEGVEAIALRAEATGSVRSAFRVAPTVLLLVLMAYSYHRYRPRNALAEQRRAVAELVAEFGEEARYLTLGEPEAQVLLKRPNLTRFGFLMRGIRDYVEDRHPGGFAGWVAELEAARPDVVLLDPAYTERMGPYRETWERYLATLEPYPRRFGAWHAFVPRR